tara:strand:+ start:7465 stop:7710 length:246 start_codon:yes stop_codon:yes gene_type:complete
MNYKNVQRKIINDILKDVKLEEKHEHGYGYHGSSKGDRIDYTTYYDKHRYEWTTDKNRALQGVIFDKLTPIINEIIKDNKL